MIGCVEMSEIGKQYNNWTIIGDAPDRIDSSGKHHKSYLCKCQCGTELIKDSYKIKNGAKMCKKCYLKILPSNGIPFDRKENRYCLSGEYGVGWTTNTNQEFYFDLEDYDKIKDYCWYSEHDYIKTTISSDKSVLAMHQLLCGIGCDHINRRRFDNRKLNLRICSQQLNMQNRSVGKNNTSGVIGVSYDKRSGKWLACITYLKKTIRLGMFKEKDDAIKARLCAEQKYFGEFASQQHLYEQYGITRQND